MIATSWTASRKEIGAAPGTSNRQGFVATHLPEDNLVRRFHQQLSGISIDSRIGTLYFPHPAADAFNC